MMDIGALQYGGLDVGRCSIWGVPVEDDYTGSLNEQLQVYGQFRGDFRINSTLHSSITINSNLQGGYTPLATTGDLKMEILIHGQFGGSYTASLDHILVKPSNVKVAIGKTKQLSAIGYDAYGNVINC